MRRAVLPALLCVAVLALLMELPVVDCLCIRSRGKPALEVLSVRATDGFVISYTHSVNKGRVHDYYRVRNGLLELYRTEFPSYGAGMPEAYETEGAEFEVTEHGYAVAGLHRVLKQLVMAVGVVANHTISVGDESGAAGRSVALTDFFAPQTSLIFEVKKVPLVAYLFSNHI